MNFSQSIKNTVSWKLAHRQTGPQWITWLKLFGSSVTQCWDFCQKICFGNCGFSAKNVNFLRIGWSNRSGNWPEGVPENSWNKRNLNKGFPQKMIFQQKRGKNRFAILNDIFLVLTFKALRENVKSEVDKNITRYFRKVNFKSRWVCEKIDILKTSFHQILAKWNFSQSKKNTVS